MHKLMFSTNLRRSLHLYDSMDKTCHPPAVPKKKYIYFFLQLDWQQQNKQGISIYKNQQETVCLVPRFSAITQQFEL